MKKLTPKQKAIFNWFVNYTNENFFNPSFAQMARRFAIYQSTLHGHWKRIGEAGYWKFKNGKDYIPKKYRNGVK